MFVFNVEIPLFPLKQKLKKTIRKFKALIITTTLFNYRAIDKMNLFKKQKSQII